MYLIDALRMRGVRVNQSTRNPSEISLNCPFCIERGKSEDTELKLGINVSTGQGHCYRCDWASRDKAHIVIARKLELGELQLAQDKKKKEHEGPVELPKDFEVFSKESCKDKTVRRARDYILTRGIADWQLAQKEIGVSLVGYYAYRIIFPVTFHDELLMIVSRDFTDKQEPKYLNSSGTKALYNLPDKRRKTLLLSEGVIKCLWLERVLGVPSGSTLGKSITDSQEDMLKGFTDIALWPDPDKAGLKGYIDVAQQLVSRFNIWFPFPPPKKQADEMGKNKIKKCMEGMTKYSVNLENRLRRYMLQMEEE